MTADTLTHPAPDTLTDSAPTNDPDPWDHITCHCSDYNLAACGLDVTHHAFVDRIDPALVCPLCEAACATGPTCPCTCVEECAY